MEMRPVVLARLHQLLIHAQFTATLFPDAMLQHFLQSPPVNVVLSAGGSLADLTGQNAPTNFAPQLHVRNHPGHLPTPDAPETRHSDAFFDTFHSQQLNIRALHNLTARPTPPSATLSRRRLHRVRSIDRRAR